MGRRRFIKNSAIVTGALLSNPIAEFFAAEVKHAQETSFLHGVASGDSSPDAVIIWTRLTNKSNTPIAVKWMISKSSVMDQIVQSGDMTAIEESDYTVKVDVKNLEPYTKYYYQFSVGIDKSPVGQTRTTSLSEMNDCNLAIVSCSNYSAGYYSAYAKIAERKDLDAVVHLGDYIYEGTKRSFDFNPVVDDEFESTHFYRNRNWWLHYYRRRYALNRTDDDLQAAHQAHPFICVWDDHEFADNAWKDGARDHNTERDGEWEIRKSAARQAYAEWLPIRGDASKIYRSVRFGKMAELVLLDTRLEGRDRQIYNIEDKALFNTDRTLLGKGQKAWLFDKIDTSPCLWKLIGSQVIFSEINVEWVAAAGRFRDKLTLLENTLLDYWQGYPAERDQLINYITQKKINNIVFLTGSFHCAAAFDVALRPAKNSQTSNEHITYDPVSRKGAVAVEFASPSINSENFDEKMGSLYAGLFQSLLNKKLPEPINYNPNPHLKFADLQRHGYYILKLTKEKAEACFYFVDDLFRKSTSQKEGPMFFTRSGQNYLQKSSI